MVYKGVDAAIKGQTIRASMVYKGQSIRAKFYMPRKEITMSLIKNSECTYI